MSITASNVASAKCNFKLGYVQTTYRPTHGRTDRWASLVAVTAKKHLWLMNEEIKLKEPVEKGKLTLV